MPKFNTPRNHCPHCHLILYYLSADHRTEMVRLCDELKEQVGNNTCYPDVYNRLVSLIDELESLIP